MSRTNNIKILILSNFFYPSLGGAETNAEILARKFTDFGHTVKVLTQTEGNNFDVNGELFPFDVIRKPSPLEMFKLVKWCNVYFHNGLSLRGLWPLLFLKRVWIVRHLGWLRTINDKIINNNIGGGSNSIIVRIKHWVNQFAVSIAISQSIADHLKYPCVIIPNPYRDNLFYRLPIEKNKQIVFLGRLVSEKGVDILLKSLSQLEKLGEKPSLTIIGDGPERSKLEQQVTELSLSHEVLFVGSKVGKDLVELLNQHDIMVVPSLYCEPFGVVALEGIGCGCVIVGSEGGGLKDAIGNCGMTFPNGDVEKLTECLFDLLTHPEKLTYYRQNAPSHLAVHTSKAVAQAYLKVIEEAIK